MPTTTWLVGAVRPAYFLALTSGLAALFAAAVWMSRGGQMAQIELPVLASVALAVLGLRWLEPRPQLYLSGALSLALAFLVLWIARPYGGVWGTEKVVLGLLPLFLLFPLGCLLLAASVTSWRAAATWYLVSGVVFMLTATWNISWGALLLFVMFTVNWPFYVLVLVRMFGYSFG
jgi:hypothetical protein